MLAFGILVFFFLVSLSSFISYNESFKKSFWYMPIAIVCSFLISLLWNIYAKYTLCPKDVFTGKMVVDAFFLSTFYVFPVMFLDMNLSIVGWIGVALFLIGFILVRIG